MAVKNYTYLSDPNDINGLNSGFKLEDYSMYVNLEVETFNRFSGKSEAIGINYVNDGKKLTFYSGTKIAKNSNFLTTNYASFTAKDIEKGETNSEGLQLSSINIEYNSWLYPQISIKFIDVRGISLMMPSQTAYSTKSKDLVSRFFRSFFMFPYPRFILHIKGFHGQIVTYTLCVSNFKSEFNSDTGNFEVNIDFVGYMYGALTDIPMKHLIISPYCDYSKDYWKNKINEGKFTFDDGRPMKTIVNIIGSIENLKDEIYKQTGLKQNMRDFKVSNTNTDFISEIKTKYKNILALISKLNTDNAKTTNFNTETNTYTIEFKSNKNVFGSDGLKTLIENINSLKYSIDNFNNSSERKLSYKNEKGKYIDIFQLLYSDDEFSKNYIEVKTKNEIYYPTSGNVNNDYINRLKNNDISNSYTYYGKCKLMENIISLESNNTQVNELLKKTIIDEQGFLASKILEFKPSIYNITKLIFAHLETYSANVTSCIEDIRNNQSKNRDIKSLNISLNDTDVSQKVEILPPFPRITKDGNDIYPYDYLNRDISETIFVDEFIKSNKKVYDEIDMLKYQNELLDSSDLTTVNFIPSLISDLFNYASVKNPYFPLVKIGATFKDIYTLFTFRCLKFLYEQEMRYVGDIQMKKEWSNFVSSEAFNFSKAFSADKLDTTIQGKIKSMYTNTDINSMTVNSSDLENIPVCVEDYNDVKYRYSIKNVYSGDNETFNSFVIKLDNGDDFYQRLLNNVSNLNQNITYNNFSFRKFEDFVFGDKARDANLYTIISDNYEKKKNVSPIGSNFYDDENKKETKKENIRDKYIERCLTDKNNNFTIPNLSVDFGESLCGHDFYYTQNTNKEKYTYNNKNFDIKDAAKGLLFLSTLPFCFNNIDFLFNKLIDNPNIKTSIIKIPRAVVLLIGGYLFRNLYYLEAGKHKLLIKTLDGEKQDIEGSFASAEGCMLLLTTQGKQFSFNDLYKIPQHVKNVLITEFINWVISTSNNTDWQNIKKQIELRNTDKTEITNIKSILGGQSNIKSILAGTAYEDTYFVHAHYDGTHKSLKLRLKSGDNDGSSNPIPAFVSELCYLCISDNRGKDIFIGKDGEKRKSLAKTRTWILFKDFCGVLSNQYYNNNSNSDIYQKMSNELSVTSTLRLSTYNTFKTLYDKWYCSNNLSVFDINNESGYFKNFRFIDSFYDDIGDKLIINLDWFIDTLLKTGSSGENTDMSIYEFVHEMCSKHGMLLMALPLFNEWNTQDKMENIFKPIPLYKMNKPKEEAMFVCIYPHKPSQFLNIEDSDYQYKGDSFSFDEKNRNVRGVNEDRSLTLPAFGVSYGKENQSIFKNISINMDNPQVTEQSIATLLELASKRESKNGAVNIKFTGQDLFDIYSNYSYTCTVDMMGCMQIMPLMYFQLNSIPMFNGAYVIIKVKHQITPGNINTTFTGVRMSKHKMKFNEKIFELEAILNVNQVNRVPNAVENENSTELARSFETQKNASKTNLTIDDFKNLKYKNKPSLGVFSGNNDATYKTMFDHVNSDLINTLYEIGLTASNSIITPNYSILITSTKRPQTEKGTYHACVTEGANCKIDAIDIQPSTAKDEYASKDSVELMSIVASYWRDLTDIIWESRNAKYISTDVLNVIHIQNNKKSRKLPYNTPQKRIFQAYDKNGDSIDGKTNKLSPGFLSVLRRLNNDGCTAISLNFGGVPINKIPNNYLI